MGGDPCCDQILAPDATNGQFGFGTRKVAVGLDDLVNALARDAEHGSDLRHAYEFLTHAGIVEKALTYDKSLGYS
jgi:hypothetical protein